MSNERQQREFSVILPIGYTDSSGQVHRRVVLRKMRGHEEALLYDASLSASQLITALLQHCVVRLGDLEPVSAPVITSLYSADRNYLLLELRRLTLGDGLQTTYQCPACQRDSTFTDNLSQIAVHWLDDGAALGDVTVELADGYEDREGVVHTELVLTLPRGADEEFVGPMIKKDPLQARDALILRCIKRFGSLPRAALEAYGVKILRELTLADRWLIQRALNGNTPGADFQRRVRCEHCGTTFETMLDVSDFFVPGQAAFSG